MNKIFESKFFNIGLPIVFFISLWVVFKYGSSLGITDTHTFIANALVLLATTLIAIAIPIYASVINFQKQKKEEIKMVIVSVSRYVGNEIIDNVIATQDLMEHHKKTIKELPPIPESGKLGALAGLWAALVEELEVSLDDKWHQSMVNSGLVAKITDDELGDSIRDVYQKMENLKKQLRRMAKFCNITLNPQDIPRQIVEYQLNTKLLEGIKATERDTAIFLEYAEKTTDVINKFLEPYGKKLEAVTYADPEK